MKSADKLPSEGSGRGSGQDATVQAGGRHAILPRGVGCPLCGTPAGHSRRDPQGCLVCPTCDLAWSITEEPENAAGAWDREYYGDPRILRSPEGRKSAADEIAARLTELCPGRGTLLDIGAGLGVLMGCAAQRGWRVEGVEPAASAAVRARSLTGAVVHQAPFEELDLPPQGYDAITVVDVLRSVPDPRRFLAAARRLLRPGGVLAIREIHRRVQHRVGLLLAGRGSWSARRRRTVFDYAQCFSPESLVFALRASGFTDLWVEPSPVFWDPNSGHRPVVAWVKRSVGSGSRMLYRLSGRRFILCPNVLAIARS